MQLRGGADMYIQLAGFAGSKFNDQYLVCCRGKYSAGILYPPCCKTGGSKGFSNIQVTVKITDSIALKILI